MRTTKEIKGAKCSNPDEELSVCTIVAFTEACLPKSNNLRMCSQYIIYKV